MRVVTAAQMRGLEDYAVNELTIPSLLLMENAALRAVPHIHQMLQAQRTPSVAIVCGPGNNGGDGLAIARHLFVARTDTVIVFVGDEQAVRGDARANLDIVRRMGIPFIPFDGEAEQAGKLRLLFSSAGLIVDALFGTGFGTRAPEGAYAEIIRLMNGHTTPIISVDIPSGICADTGRKPGEAVRAAMTVTYGFPKIGLLLYPGAEYAGEVQTEDISIPRDVQPGMALPFETLTDGEIPALLPVRMPLSHKGTFGRVCVLAGSRDMPGAAALCCGGAYRAGAGLVEACAVKEAARAVQQHVPEALATAISGKNGQYDIKSCAALESSLQAADVLLIGPGLGRSKAVTTFVRTVLTHAQTPVILDADGLNAVAEDISLLKKITRPCAITPHPGEMNRLTGIPVPEITADPVGTAAAFTREYGVITLLKGARTVIACPDGRIFINTTGNASMAKAGSGDALAGIIAGLAAQGQKTGLGDACALGAFLHGRAGEEASTCLSRYGVTATDLINTLPRVMKRYESV